MRNDFEQLVLALNNYPNAMDSSTLHGFLTVSAIGPNEVLDQFWLQAILNISPKTTLSETMEELENRAIQAVDQTLDEIADERFHPQSEISDTDNKTLKAWCNGFQQAILLAESKWKAFHDVCPDAALIGMTITAITQPEVAEAAFSVPQEKHETFVAKQAPLLGSSIEAYYQMLIKMGSEEVDDINLQPPTLEDLPRFNKEELTQKSNDELNETGQNYLPSRVDTYVREQPKAGRNDPCPCGSGKKYKKCCLH